MLSLSWRGRRWSGQLCSRRIRFGPLFALIVGALSCPIASASTRVWIDTDPSIGAPWREVDDAYALLLAFRSPELRLAGLSTTYGNAGVRRTTAVAQRLVRQFAAGAGVSSVAAGASSPRDLGHHTEATAALAAALRRERLTYLALGPLTNLATLLREHPELAGRIERVVFGGGLLPGRPLAFGPNGRMRIHDANVFKDPAAVRVLLAAGIPITLLPVKTSSQLMLTEADLNALAHDGEAGKFLARGSRFWLWFWTSIVGERGGPLFDAALLAIAARPDMAETEEDYATVDGRGNLIVLPAPAEGALRLRLCRKINPRAKAFLLQRLLSPPAPRK